MACATAVPAATALGGQLSLASSATRREGCKPAHQCSGLATMRLNAARSLPLQQACSSSGFTGLTQGSQRRLSVVAKVSETPADEQAVEAVQDFVNQAKEAWEKIDDKLAIGTLGFAALLTLWASTGLIAAIDKLPLLPNFFKFVGLLVSGVFVYRYVLFKPDREELLKSIDNAKSKITGQ